MIDIRNPDYYKEDKMNYKCIWRSYDPDVVILVLSGCIHHCKACSHPERSNADGNLFTLDTMEEIIDKLGALPIPELLINGGDPFNDTNVNTVKELVLMARRAFDNITITAFTDYTVGEISKSPEKLYLLKQFDYISIYTRDSVDGECDRQDYMDGYISIDVKQFLKHK